MLFCAITIVSLWLVPFDTAHAGFFSDAFFTPISDFFHNVKEGWKAVFTKDTEDTPASYEVEPRKISDIPPPSHPPSFEDNFSHDQPTLVRISSLELEVARLVQLYNSIPQSAGLAIKGITNEQLASFTTRLSTFETRMDSFEERLTNSSSV